MSPIGQRISVLMPIRAGGMTTEIAEARRAPVRRRLAAIRAAGGTPGLTIYPDAGHDSWTRTYDDPAVWQWLLGHVRAR